MFDFKKDQLQIAHFDMNFLSTSGIPEEPEGNNSFGFPFLLYTFDSGHKNNSIIYY